MLKINEINFLSLIKIGEEEQQLVKKQMSRKREVTNLLKKTKGNFEQTLQIINKFNIY